MIGKNYVGMGDTDDGMHLYILIEAEVVGG